MPTIICSWCLAAFGDDWDAAVEHEKTCEYNQERDVLDESMGENDSLLKLLSNY